MRLVIGGIHQGKRTFAHTLSDHVYEDLHLAIRESMLAGDDPCALAERIADEYADGAITVAETGCGLIPMEAFEREYRECVGRISCRLAAQAEAVYRVNCGIAVRIK